MPPASTTASRKSDKIAADLAAKQPHWRTSRTNLWTETPSNRLGMMQEGGGKLSHKSDEIAKTPTQGSSAVVTPSTKISKREQAQAKKIKQGKKKGLADFFGQGPRVPVPSREGTPINAVIQLGETADVAEW